MKCHTYKYFSIQAGDFLLQELRQCLYKKIGVIGFQIVIAKNASNAVKDSPRLFDVIIVDFVEEFFVLSAVHM